MRSAQDLEERRRVIGFVTAVCSTLKLHLRKEANAVPELGEVLMLQDIMNIERSNHMPNFCLDVITYYLMKQVKEGKLTDYQSGLIDKQLSVFVDKIGTCERIRNTPIPLSYALQLRFLICVWLIAYCISISFDCILRMVYHTDCECG